MDLNFLPSLAVLSHEIPKAVFHKQSFSLPVKEFVNLSDIICNPFAVI